MNGNIKVFKKTSKIMGILSVLRNSSVQIVITTIFISFLFYKHSKCISQDINEDSSISIAEQLPFCDEEVVDNRESSRR